MQALTISNLNPSSIRTFISRHKNPLIFLAGFLFDAITIRRIDAWSDLLLQIIYLAGLSFLLIYQYRENKGLWRPSGRVSRLWRYNVEILHFLYGGLLSAYVILYLKSTSGLRGLVYLVFLCVLLLLNEMPQIRRFGYRLRLGLYAFCVASFFIYFIPILIGRMGPIIFVLSLLLAAFLVWFVAGILVSKEEDKKRLRLLLYWPAATVLSLLLLAYYFRLIPPVPLSIRYQGIFHDVIRTNDGFILHTPKPPFYAFWRKDSRPFYYREGEKGFYFVRLYAPTRFKHNVLIRWALYNEAKRSYMTTDLVPMPIVGGRGEGFRGYVYKSSLQTGRWKVSTETDDGRLIGYLTFSVILDSTDRPRKWKELKM